ncbi:probable chitinase 2 [Amyelois transitella]|uniref:probable chitinase 2 n=1 Tax=Amyelois transitella TaxID=680683 RepID=UPI00067D1587|nr:probable chitinase 2 [Amyelois transitella]
MSWLALVFLLSCSSYFVYGDKVVVCYYGTWATYRAGLGKFAVENVNTDLCSHVVYSFTGIDSQGTMVSLDSNLDLDAGQGNFRKFTNLKEKNPNLKTILAVGGWNEGSARYSIMAANPTFRQNFIQSALAMIREYNFDGLDLDWEYPNRRDTVHGLADVDNFTQLIRELKEEFDKFGLLLTAAVSSVRASASFSYDIPVISQYLDYIHLMTYDMYGAWDPMTGHNAPLHKGEGDTGDRQDLYTVDVAVEYWLGQGCPPEKLVLGMPLYGRTFTLTNPAVNGVRAPAIGAGLSGPYTATAGYMGYNEICDRFQTETWDLKYDSLAKVPYAIQGANWISYDDAQSLTRKIEYANSLNLAGGMVWSIETDDFNNVCGDGHFPLLRAINKALGRNENGGENEKPDTTTKKPSTTAATSKPSTTTTIDPSTTTDQPKTTTKEPVTTSSTTTEEDSIDTIVTDGIVTTSSTVPSEATTTPKDVNIVTTEATTISICKEEGFTADPEDCSSFYMCVFDGNGELKPRRFKCPATTFWDQENLICNYGDKVQCDLD